MEFPGVVGTEKQTFASVLLKISPHQHVLFTAATGTCTVCSSSASFINSSVNKITHKKKPDDSISSQHIIGAHSKDSEQDTDMAICISCEKSLYTH